MIKDDKKLIERDLLWHFQLMSMDKPSNFDDILEYVINDMEETADQKNWSIGDITIGFRRWIEEQSLKL